MATYFDSEGTKGSYRIAIDGADITINWELYRFVGSVSADRKTITGTWELSKDRVTWGILVRHGDDKRMTPLRQRSFFAVMASDSNGAAGRKSPRPDRFSSASGD